MPILKTHASARPARLRPRRRPLGASCRPSLPRVLTLGRSEDAAERYRRSLRCKEAQGDQAGMAACYLQIGDLYMTKGDGERAGEMYRKSLEISRRLPGDRPARAF